MTEREKVKVTVIIELPNKKYTSVFANCADVHITQDYDEYQNLDTYSLSFIPLESGTITEEEL